MGGGLRENDIFSANNCGKYNCSTLLIQILSLRDRHLGKRKYNTDSKIYLNIRCARFSFIHRGKSVAVMEKMHNPRQFVKCDIIICESRSYLGC